MRTVSLSKEMPFKLCNGESEHTHDVSRLPLAVGGHVPLLIGAGARTQ